jgi:cytidylate kinase
MPIIAITREMGSLGKDVARELGAQLGLPVVYHEVIDHLADRMRVRKSHVIRLLASLSLFTADEIIGIAAKGPGAVIRGWGATHLLRDVPHAVCVRVCAPFETRKRRMMERLESEDEARIAEEIRVNDEAHSAIMRRHFDLQWTDAEHYDVVLNTKRVAVEECVREVLALARAPETREAQVAVISECGKVTLSGAGSTDEMLAFVEVASAVPGVRDVAYRTRPGEELRPRFH